jgi:3-oxoacyl-[acyl-carrier-protein] synthase-3
MRGGGSLNPATHETVDKKLHYIYQDGKAVFKLAVVGMADISAEIMERNHLTGKDVDWLVPHQANLRIIDATRERMGLDKSKVMINIQKYGNTTAATIPLCLSEWWQTGKLRKGQTIVLAAFGAGYTWGSVLIRWTLENAA